MDGENGRETDADDNGLEIVLLGWPSDGPTLRLDYERFSYAGKFVMSNTGKAVVRDECEREHGRDREREHEYEGGHEPDLHDSERENRAHEGFDDVVAAVAFNEDRTDPDTLWLRYVTVRADKRGDGLGPRLIAFVRDRARERGYDRVRIAVNNPFAYEALARVGFHYTGETTGIAEVVLEYTASDGGRGCRSSVDAETYRRGLEEFRDREGLTDEERTFLEAKYERGPPKRIAETIAGDSDDSDERA